MVRACSTRESALVLRPFAATHAVTSSANERSSPIVLIKAAFRNAMKFSFRPAIASEIQLCTEDESVFRFAGTMRVSVEYGPLEVERVFQISGKDPVQASCPGFCLTARPGSCEIKFERPVTDFQGVISGSHLKGAQMAVVKIEVGARAYAAGGIRCWFAGQHVRGR